MNNYYKIMKKIKIVYVLFSALIMFSCSKSETNLPPVLEDVVISQRFGGRGFDVGFLITTMQAVDPEEDMLLYSIVSQTPANSVTISSTTGDVFVQDVDSFQYNLNQQVKVSIKVSDGNSDTTADLIINIERPQS